MKIVKTISLQFPNGDLILGTTGRDENRMFFIKTSDGIFEYSTKEVKEIYSFVPIGTSIVGEKVVKIIH